MAASMLAAAAFIVAAVLASAQSASWCTQTLIGVLPCLNYITGNVTTPSKSCCSQLATVLSSKPECLCAALRLGNVNKTRALPDHCGIPLSLSSKCASAPAPTSSGAGAGRV